MPPRKPPTDVHLHEFLLGLFAVLGMRGPRRFSALPGILDAALADTVQALQPVAEKLKVRPRFRLAPDALAKPGSTLEKALRKLEQEAVVRFDGDDLEVPLSGAEAYVELEALDYPLTYAERAAKAFVKRHAVARVRAARPTRPNA